MRKGRECGAIVVEATISLTAFMFAIFTILSLVNIYYIQAKMGVALNSAAKEISQYSYLYYLFDVDELDKKLHDGTDEYEKVTKNTIDGMSTLVGSLSNGKQAVAEHDYEKLFEEADKDIKTVDSLVNEYKDLIGDDPKGFILGMGKMAAAELGDNGKALLAQVLAKTFMEKNLKATPEDNADSFLKRHGVEKGMDGLNFNYTALMANGTSNEIQLCVTYDVSVIKLLDIDFKFKFRQVSRTCAWGDGISLIPLEPKDDTPDDPDEPQKEEPSIWDSDNDNERGVYIVRKEKTKYTYTSSGKGFDAYDKDKNEFITITSANTFLSTYQTANGIRKKIRENYTSMATQVGRLDEQITVTSGGKSVELKSDKDTRKYRVVLVVPEGADITLVRETANDFMALNEDVTVEIRQGYGTPKKKTAS